MRVTSTLVVVRGEIGVRKGRTVLFICDLKDAGMQAGYEDLAAVAELYGLAFTKEEYDRCLEVLGVKSPRDTVWKLADDALSVPSAVRRTAGMRRAGPGLSASKVWGRARSAAGRQPALTAPQRGCRGRESRRKNREGRGSAAQLLLAVSIPV
jgi:hypothetical protein